MKNLKVLISLSLMSVFLLFILGCNSKKENVIKIGCSAPLTGEGANYGKVVKEGIDLAVEEINRTNFLKRPLTVVFEDDKMNPRDGISAVNKLINVDKVPIILGPFGSSIMVATAPIAEKNKVIMISASATADNLKDAGDYIFRIVPPNSKQGSDIALFSYNKLKARTAVTIYQINDYGETLKAAFDKKFSALGGKVESVQGIVLNTTDFRTTLLNIKKIKPDVIFFPLHYQDGALMLKQAKELGIHSFFISADGAMTEDLLKIAGDAAEGTFYSTLALGYGIADEKIKQFEEKFKAKYHKEPAVYSAYYYEVTFLIANAIKKVGTNPDKIKNFLYSISGNNKYFGITGYTSFDRYGEVDKPFYIYVVKNGKYVLYK